MNAPQFKIELDGVGHFLADNEVRVPKYQRSFAWEERQVADLVQDIKRAMDADEPEYFIGSIVLAEAETEPAEVVDGQQRLATISMILSTVRDMFRLLDAPDAATDVNKFLTRHVRRTHATKSRLTLNYQDNDFFRLRVLDDDAHVRETAKPSRHSHKRIAEACVFLTKYLAEQQKAAATPDDYLHDLVDFLETNVRAIFVRVPSHANAFMIFETLNDRGLDLAISDLLKNYLFHRAGSRVDEVQTKWISMYGLFEAGRNEGLVVDYVRQLWSSWNGLTRERQLYDRIKDTVKGREQVVQFAGQLEDGARVYQAIINTDHPLWTEYGVTARQHMGTLNTLGITRIRPLVMAVLDCLQVAQTRNSLRLFVSWAVRFMISGGLGTGTLEEYYCERAREVRNGTIKSAARLRDAMAKLVPNDEKFRAAFAAASLSKAPLARYVLRTLERARSGEEQPELLVNENEHEVNLEHVLPDTPSAAWNVTAEVADAYLNRIGNLCLMKQRPNVAAANKGPKEKSAFYETSRLELTKAVGRTIKKSKRWGPAEIDARQKELADLAVRAWTLKL